ncbi:MAG: response regulator [Desulfobacteraceae bacterium]
MAADKILLIDDEEANVRLLAMSLKSDGYEVSMAYSGEQGLELFREQAPDIVITDIKMPGMDGLEVLKKVKEISPETEVIIITGHGDIDSTITALQYGASDFINKPVRDEALSIALKRARTKIEIREKLNEYTENLENKVKEATEEIRRRANFQRLLIKHSNDGIVATDRDWNIVVFNPEAERIFGCPRDQVKDRETIDNLFMPEIADAFKNCAKAEAGQRSISWRETSFHTKDGREIPVRYSGSILRENDEMVGSVAFFHDLTEIKKLEKELVQSERMAAVGQTVSGLAHYIKNILIGLKGGSYVVDVGLEKNKTEKLKTGWQTIKKNIERVSDLVQNLLAYARESDPDYQQCKPNEIVNEVLDLLEPMASEYCIDVTKEVDPSIGEVSMDPQTIHRSVLNLISNAIDACRYDEDTSKNWQIHIKTFIDEKSMLCIEVEDNGCGMSRETREKIFNSFYSTKGGKGTGLGLLVTGKLIDAHKGRIEFNSEIKKGTTFTIHLPYDKVDNENSSASEIPKEDE